MLRLIYAVLLNAKRGPHILPTMRKMIKHKDKYSEEKRYAYAQKLIRYLQNSAKITTEVFGLENLPKEGGYVMFPNHQGKYDALGIIYAHKSPCRFVMDKAKSYGFLVKELVDLIDAKRLELDNIRQNMRIINEMADEVATGKKYIIFSEGGYDRNKNNVQDFKPGSFKCATKVNAPIVPVALIDSYLPFNSNKFGPVTTKVVFLKPLYPEEYANMKTPEIADTVRNRIIEAINIYQNPASVTE